jgi:NO-binding membrane sensor protein with MHYT domain
MLAFTPGIPSGYNILLTALSLFAAILLTGVGLAVSLTPDWRHGPWAGGAIVAGGIAAMHYTGMAAFEIAGIILWDPVLVTASIALGAVIGAVPFHQSSGEAEMEDRRALLLTLQSAPPLHRDGRRFDRYPSSRFRYRRCQWLACGRGCDREPRHSQD